jgi:hypothetical protein
MKELKKPVERKNEDGKASQKIRDRRFRDRNVPAGRMTFNNERIKEVDPVVR